MKSHLFLSFLFILILCLSSIQSVEAQFTTATVDGIISANEYGVHTNGQNQQASGGQTWYLTWDDNNLYVAVTNANTAEGAVLYIDMNPTFPVNGGTNFDGTLVGFNYDGAVYNPLPFRADFVIYFKNGYHEYRRANGSGGWTPVQVANGFPYSSAGNNREIAIPWINITGTLTVGGISSRPSSFLHLEYVTSSGGFIYGQLPTENPSGNVGTFWEKQNESWLAGSATNFFRIAATGNGIATKPFQFNQTPAAPTASTGLVKGRVLDSLNAPVSSARVTILNTSTGESQVVRTNALGYFSFEEIPVGNFYVVTVTHKLNRFNPVSFQMLDNEKVLEINGE